MARQWRWSGGMESQRVGLDHGVLPLHFEMASIRKKQRKAVFDGLQAMECAALGAWNDQHKKP